MGAAAVALPDAQACQSDAGSAHGAADQRTAGKDAAGTPCDTGTRPEAATAAAAAVQGKQPDLPQRLMVAIKSGLQADGKDAAQAGPAADVQSPGVSDESRASAVWGRPTGTTCRHGRTTMGRCFRGRTASKSSGPDGAVALQVDLSLKLYLNLTSTLISNLTSFGISP